MTTIKRKHHKHRPLSKLAQRRKKLFLFKIGGIVAALLLIVTGVVFGLRAERINIADIDIKGNSALATKALREFAEEEISGNYAYVLPKSSILLYPRKNLQATLLESFKEIKEVDVSYGSLQSISISIEERKPYALYCGTQISTTTDCYFLDEGGFIFTKAPEFSGNVFLRYFGKIEEGEPVGKQFVDTENFRETNFFLASLFELGLNPITFSIVNEDDLEIMLEAGGKIMFGQKQSLSNIYENIQSVFDGDEFDEEGLSTLDYADFRFGNKVYFKFK
jgi:hypothetical protein